MGPVDVSAAYYYCQHCKHGHKPREKILRLNAIALPPAAEELVALAGTGKLRLRRGSRATEDGRPAAERIDGRTYDRGRWPTHSRVA